MKPESASNAGPMKCDAFQVAYQCGYDAYYYNPYITTPVENPYAADSGEHTAWVRGFQRAVVEYSEDIHHTPVEAE